MELGSKSFIDTFEDQLIGAKTGDEITVKVSFPENYHSKELAGKPATFDVKINSVSTPGEQEVNDEFINKNLNIESLEKFHEMIKKELTSIYERGSKNKIKNAIFEWLKKNVKIELPKTIVDEEFHTGRTAWKPNIKDLERFIKDEIALMKTCGCAHCDYRRQMFRKMQYLISEYKENLEHR